MPFELPKGWVWCRLGDLAEVQLGKMLDKKNTNGEPHSYLANASVRWGSFDLDNLKQMPFIEEEVEKFALKPGDIIMCEGGVPGRCAVWREKESHIKYQKALHRIRLYEISSEYVRYYFEAIHDTLFFTAQFSGSTIHHLPRETLIQFPVPLPPLNDQERIVAKIEELFKIADSLGEAADGLEKAAKRLDKKILDLAIRGKLVPQDSNDEPASVLLERVLAVKDAKSTKGKASHRSPNGKSGDGILSRTETQSCGDGELFELPKGWAWCKLGEIISLLSGRDLSPSNYSSSRLSVPYITGASNFIGDELIVNRWTDQPVTLSHKGDLLITCKGTVGTMAFNLIGDIHIARQIMAISSSIMNLNYIKIFLSSIIDLLKASATSMIPGIDRSTLLNILIPLPPLAEQKRIVKKVEELRKTLSSILPS